MDQLLIALDVATRQAALDLAGSLRDVAGGFKVGSRLFTAEGPGLVRTLTDRGHRVFLDLKFHDIPNTVATAVAAATSLGVWMVNVHAAGGSDMMRAAAQAARETGGRLGVPAPLVIAVTVLTSVSPEALDEIGLAGPLIDHVLKLARLARSADLDGVVASPQETAVIRRCLGSEFAIVTPGIRGGHAETAGKDDQARTMSAAEAITAGASYIVVGRPVIAAADPLRAAERIALEMEHASRSSAVNLEP